MYNAINQLKKEIRQDVKDLNISISAKPCKRICADKKYETGLYITSKYYKLIDLKVLDEVSYAELIEIFQEGMDDNDFINNIIEYAKKQNNITGDLTVNKWYFNHFNISNLPEKEDLSRDKLFYVEEDADYWPLMQTLEITYGFLVFYFNPDRELIDSRSGLTFTEDINGNRHYIEPTIIKEGNVRSKKFGSNKDEKKSRYEEGEDVPLEELPEEFQEMNENPPESVKNLTDKMKKKALAQRVARRFLARYERGVSVPLEDLPEEFQEMNENPPESVLRIRNR